MHAKKTSSIRQKKPAVGSDLSSNRYSWRGWWWPLLAIVAMLGVLPVISLLDLAGQSPARARAWRLSEIPFDGAASYQVLKELCQIGSRTSGTKGMERQQAWVEDYFTKLGGKVSFQRFEARHPLTGAKVPMANAIIEWHPERKERILICCHYDTRPFPDNDPDPRRRKSLFVGANDGASGVALLSELGKHMPQFESKYGVDFVLFDGEELVYDGSRDPYFLGSEHFAREYVMNPPAHKYLQGVLVDMIADAELHLFYEQNSIRYARATTESIWAVAARLGISEFRPRIVHEVRDDHLPLNTVAKIPTCDIIDFDYPVPGARGTYWHTTNDTPQHCSALSLAKVGWVLHEWLKEQK